MGRRMRIAVLGAAVVGSTGGGLAALWWSSEPPRAPAVVPPGPVAAAAPVAPVATDRNTVLIMQIRIVLTRFAAWSRANAGAPCPTAAALGVVALDPWGHDIELTCTDQPADQQIGAISAGPDGVLDTRDDVMSWTLGAEITDLVRGARWGSGPAMVAAHPASRPPAAKHGPPRKLAPGIPPSPAPVTAQPIGSAAPTGDDIPARR